MPRPDAHNPKAKFLTEQFVFFFVKLYSYIFMDFYCVSCLSPFPARVEFIFLVLCFFFSCFVYSRRVSSDNYTTYFCTPPCLPAPRLILGLLFFSFTYLFLFFCCTSPRTETAGLFWLNRHASSNKVAPARGFRKIISDFVFLNPINSMSLNGNHPLEQKKKKRRNQLMLLFYINLKQF